jgi:hypothetical protein
MLAGRQSAYAFEHYTPARQVRFAAPDGSRRRLIL